MIDFSLIQWISVITIIALLVIWYFYRKSGKKLRAAEEELDKSVENLRKEIQENARVKEFHRVYKDQGRPTHRGSRRRGGIDEEEGLDIEDLVDGITTAAVVGAAVTGYSNVQADEAEEMVRESLDRVVDHEVESNPDFAKPERTYTPAPSYEPPSRPSYGGGDNDGGDGDESGSVTDD